MDSGKKVLMQRPDFKPAKLSHEALDTFVKKYITTKYGDSIKYQTKTKEIVDFSPTAALSIPFSANEYRYLLFQTLPYHLTESPKYFPLSTIAIIVNEKGEQEYWTTDTRLLTDFVRIGEKLGTIKLRHENGQMYFMRYPGPPAITYSEKEST